MGVKTENMSTLIRAGIKRRLVQFAYGNNGGSAQTKAPTYKPTDPAWKKIFGWGNEKEELVEPFKQLPIIRAAITAKSSNIAQVPFRIRRIGAEEFDTSGHMFDLFETVNPHMSKYDLWQSIVINLEGWGDAPVFEDPEDERAPNIPMYLWPELATNVQAKFYNNEFVGWELRRGGKRLFFLPSSVIFPKHFNPWNKLRGLSPMSALQLTNESDFSAIKYNQVIFENDVTVGMVFSAPADSVLEDEDMTRIEESLIAKRKGVVNAEKALILDGGMTAQDMRPKNKEMQFIELRKFNREDVSMVFKVPKPELELYEDINYATALSSDLAFWKKTLIPLMRLIADKFNTDFLSLRGYEGYFDIRAIDVLNREILEKAKTAKVFVDMGYPLNIVNDRLGLDFPDVPWGDEPLNLMPTLPDAEPEGNEPKGITHVTAGLTPNDVVLRELRKKKWLAIVQTISPTVSACSRDVGQYFFRIEQRILRKMVKRVGGESVVKTVMKTEPIDLTWLDDMFDTDELKRIIQGYVGDSANVGISSIKTSVRMPVDSMIRTIAGARVGSKITDINTHAISYIRLKLTRIVDDSIAAGFSEAQLAQEIVAGMKGAMRNIRRRARTIARTEVHGAYAHGRHMAIVETKPKAHMWISTHDDVVRDSHEDMDGQQVPIDEPFVTPSGSELMFPLDPDGEAGEVINCRCAEIAIYDD